jgi:hypothetical protein
METLDLITQAVDDNPNLDRRIRAEIIKIAQKEQGGQGEYQ